MSVWNWDYFWGYAANAYLLEGAITTLWLTAVSLALGLVLGLGIALMRMSGWRAAARAAQGYTWIFRGTPLLVQLIIIYTGLPQLGLRLSVIESAILGLMLNEAAYLSEIIRAGIQAIAHGQWEAAFALGLSRWLTFGKVILPQAMRVIIPPLGNSVNGLLKTTSIASVISMEELLRRGQILQQEHFAVLEIFSIIAILYLAMTTCWDAVQRWLETYYGRGFGTVQLARDDH